MTVTADFKSQYGQDRWVLSVLKNMKHGYFVDVGAYTGIALSNTYALERCFDWRGICIEPDNRVFPMLQANRSCITDNSCVSNSRKQVKFAEIGTLGGVVSEYSSKHKARVVAAHPDYAAAVVDKTTVVLPDLLAKYMAPVVIDYLSLDTEGSELGILKAHSFRRYAFRCITVEHNGYPARMKLIRRLLESKGYKIVKTGSSDFFVINPELI